MPDPNSRLPMIAQFVPPPPTIVITGGYTHSQFKMPYGEAVELRDSLDKAILQLETWAAKNDVTLEVR